MSVSFLKRVLPTLTVCLGLVAATLGVTSSQAGAVAPAAGFQDQAVADNLAVPVAMQFAPDGAIFVAQKSGEIKVINNGAVSQFGKLQVNSEYEQGLLGLVFDPSFDTNGFLYVAYTNVDGLSNRVSRVTASAADRHVMVAGSEKVLLDGIPSPTGIHQMGELQIGTDGKLYIAAGDGAIDAQTAQRLDTLTGKILRINVDGTVPADNPFVDQQGARSEIWAYGFRNPFTSSIDPVSGRFFVNDVGNNTWEEINELKKGGNFGWTTCEGVCTPARAGFTDPVFQYNHTTGEVVGRSIAGGAWYRGSAYPSSLYGHYIFADYTSGWIKELNVDTKAVTTIANDVNGITSLKVGPDGFLYYVRLNVNTGAGSVHRLVTGTTPPPPPVNDNTITVYAAGTPAAGVYPTAELLIDDAVVATFTNVRGNPGARQFVALAYNAPAAVTPERVKVRYPNDFYSSDEDRNLYVDKITIGQSTFESEAPSVLSTGTWTPETNCAPGNKKSEVLSCGGYFQYGATPGPVNRPPVATINAPALNSTFRAGDNILFSGSATDPEDGNLPVGRLSWNIVLHHDQHSHPFLTFAGQGSETFQIPVNGEAAANIFYRLQLTATDSAGATSTVTRDITPLTTEVTLQTNVPGLEVNLDGSPKTTPNVFVGVQGFKRLISAAATQSVGGKNFEFVSWSDGGAASHEISTPNTATTYTANYREVAGPPPPPSNATPITVYAAGSPAAGVYPTAELLIDDAVVATFTDVRGNPGARQFVALSYNSPTPVTADRIKVRYPNDLYANGEDRNLYVDKITVGQVDYESEDPGVVSTGTWTPDTNCAAGNKRSEVLSCGGYFQYGAGVTQPPAGGSTLKIYAAGSPAAGVYPNLEVVVNGAVVKTFNGVQGNPGSRNFEELTYNSSAKLSLAQLQLRFTNDALIGNEDRNLTVDKINLDGTNYETEAAGVYSVGSWDPASGCGGGNKRSETLSCNGYFTFG